MRWRKQSCSRVADTPDRDQKTQAPTAKRRADAAKNGDVLQSKELGAALVMLAGVGWILLAGPALVAASKQLIVDGLSLSHADIAGFDPAEAAKRFMLASALPLLTLFALTLLAAVGATASLGSLGFRGAAMAFKGSRIDPLAGIKRIFGTQGLIELLKSLAKTLVLGGIGYWLLSDRMAEMFALGRSDIARAAESMGETLLIAVALLAGGFLLIAGVDLPAQIFQRNVRLRMTLQEVKEEMRQSEGAPELKQAVRQRQHAILSGSARRAVQDATVILTNPTHFAVALRYDPARDKAPLVLARGCDETALAIRALAGERQVPTLEYPQLTRAIYYTSRAGQTIDEELYVAVATVLAFVFRLEQSLADGMAQPSIVVPEARRFDAAGKPEPRP